MAKSFATPDKPLQLKTRWVSSEAPLQTVSEALLSAAGGLVYVTLGQTQIPLPRPDGTAPDSAEIQVVARLAFSESTFHKIQKAFNEVGEQLLAANKTEPASR